MPSYRYPGPRPFEENDINLFFGRKKDTENLLTFINVEQLVVLFSKSGIGKSSLINAGILPELRKKNYDVIVGRFNSFVNLVSGQPNAPDLLSPVKKLLNEIKSRYNNTTTFLDPLSPEGEEISLWHEFKNLQIANKEKTYFIFFDQFEELFTYPPEQVNYFKQQLAELLYTAVPQEYLDRIDKFENDPSTTHLTNEQLELLYEPIPVKILFTIRSDKFSSLTKLKDAIPGIVTKTYELKPFSASEAKDAIQNPALSEGDFISNAFEFEPDALQKMLDYLTEDGTEDIESFQLQILCRYVEEIVIKNKRSNNELRHVNASHIGDIKNIFEEYYNNLISNIDADKIQNVKKLFEEGLIFEKDKIRVSLYKGQITSMYGIDELLLKKLVDTHLIRSETDANGMEKFELSHDSLIQPILKSKEKRMVEEEAKVFEANAQLQKIKFRKRLQLYASIFFIIVLLAGLVLYKSYENAKTDRLKISFLVAERDWFHFLDPTQQEEVLKKDFLFVIDKDLVSYNKKKYAYKCAALSNRESTNDPTLALRLAHEGLLKDSNSVTRRSFNNLIQNSSIHLPSLIINCGGIVKNARLIDDTIIVVSSKGIFWYDAANGRGKDSLTSPEYQSDYSIFSADGSYLIYGTFNSNIVRILNVHLRQYTEINTNYEKTISHPLAFDISSDNNFFVVATKNNKAKMFSLNGELSNDNFPSDEEITELAFSPDGKSFAAAMLGGSVFLSSNTFTGLTDSAGKNLHSDVINSISFSHDGKFILTGSSDKEAKIWDIKKSQVIQTFKYPEAVLKCRFSANDSFIIVGQNNIITRWQIKKGNPADTVKFHKDALQLFTKDPLQLIGWSEPITSVNFYNNDQNIIATSKDDVSLWDLINPIPLSQLNTQQIPPLILSEKINLGLVTLQDLLSSKNKKEVMEAITLLHDSLQKTETYDATLNTTELTDLISKLYNHLKKCKEGDLSKKDSFNLFLYMGNSYSYKIEMNDTSMGRNKSILDSLIKFREKAFILDTLYPQSFQNLIEAYHIPLGYYLRKNKPDSALFWNNQILKHTPKLNDIPEIRNDLMIVYQYDVTFRILNSDYNGAMKSIENWPMDKRGLNYELSNELVKIFTIPNYHLAKTKIGLDDNHGIRDMRFILTFIIHNYTKKDNISNNLQMFYDYLSKYTDAAEER